MGSFVQYRHLEGKSEDLESYQVLLRAFDRIDDLLQSLDDGVQVYRGLGAFEVQVPTAEEGVEAVTPSTLDYLVRTGEAEVQIEVLLPPVDGFSLPRETVHCYSRIILGNWRTEAIIVVWGTEQLDSVAFDGGQLLHYLKTEQQKISIPPEDVRPLAETLSVVRQKHKPTFWYERDIQERRKTEFDLLKAFRHYLLENYRKLVRSAPRVRIGERRLAIKSIPQGEIATLGDLVAQCIDQELSLEELREVITDISQHVQLD